MIKKNPNNLSNLFILFTKKMPSQCLCSTKIISHDVFFPWISWFRRKPPIERRGNAWQYTRADFLPLLVDAGVRYANRGFLRCVSAWCYAGQMTDVKCYVIWTMHAYEEVRGLLVERVWETLLGHAKILIVHRRS